MKLKEVSLKHFFIYKNDENFPLKNQKISIANIRKHQTTKYFCTKSKSNIKPYFNIFLYECNENLSNELPKNALLMHL